jgi:hypothetical protein
MATAPSHADPVEVRNMPTQSREHGTQAYFFAASKERYRSDIPRSISVEVEAIEVHHLVPGRDEAVDELLFPIGASVDFSQGAELAV